MRISYSTLRLDNNFEDNSSVINCAGGHIMSC